VGNDPATGPDRHSPPATTADGTQERPCNVVILTGGLTGSSVLAGLLAATGYWCGSGTFRKSDYDTFENHDLIRLNQQLMSRVPMGEEYTRHFRADAIAHIAALRREPLEEYRDFVAGCNAHEPWLWKDPRLWLTIRFWRPLLPPNTRFLLLRRELTQAWISMTLRRTIQTVRYTREYHRAIQDSLCSFLDESSLPYMSVLFEDLLLQPEREIERLRGFLGVELTMEHVHQSYRGRLYRRPKGVRDALLASLIYLKNYGERLR
jgi:hypothetical protein